MARCEKGRRKPKLKGKKPKFRCQRCGMPSRKKKDLCKPR